MKKSILDCEGLDYYFDSYSHIGIHHDMLTDVSRTTSYQKAMVNNPQLFKEKIVMDIGCGTGILSMFAAKAGAKKVVAIEMASIINMARRIVKENCFEKTIEFCRGKIEEVKVPVAKVDIIVSEWMGYLLLFEGMLDSVLFARDKYLAKGGMLFPNQEIIYVAGFEDFEFEAKAQEYSNINDFDYSEFADVKYIMPTIKVIDTERLITSSAEVVKFDLEKVTIKELDFSKQFRIKASRQGTIHGLVLWFDSLFTHGTEVINLSTSPFAEPTHWKQGLMYLKKPIPVNKNDKVDVILTMKKNPNNPRDLDIRVDYRFKNSEVEMKEHQFYMFK